MLPEPVEAQRLYRFDPQLKSFPDHLLSQQNSPPKVSTVDPTESCPAALYRAASGQTLAAGTLVTKLFCGFEAARICKDVPGLMRGYAEASDELQSLARNFTSQPGPVPDNLAIDQGAKDG
jgi:hypothetical protein